MSADTPDHVICRITGVTHKIVSKNQNEEEFVNYLKNILQRLKMEKMIYVAIDCEGWELGIRKNSLGLIQMGECFDENLMMQKPKGRISINLKPGFLIRTPIREDIIELMSQVFTDRYLSLITFDFTADITSMMDVGLRFNMENVIDAQVTRPLKGELNFTNRKCIGLKATCKGALNCAEFKAAYDIIEEKKDIDFDEAYCNTIVDQDQFSHLLNNKFWEDTSSDIALTAIALTTRLNECEPCYIKESSNSKAKAFVEIQEKNGFFAPVLMRQFSFIDRGFSDNRKITVKEGYKIIHQSDIILDNYDTYKALSKKNQIKSKSEIYNAIEKALNKIYATRMSRREKV